MITVGMQYDVIPGKESAFEGGFKAVEDALKSEWKGHKLTRLFKDVFKPTSYMIYSEWETFEDFQKFMTSEAFRKAADWGKEEILAGRPKHQILKHEGGPPGGGRPGH
ncbi:MAG TPA: antibiotic biosynthesis monooxygenase [Planctomycetota bacterium]|nr:antibiotic biosynthesis monooxygenase [Planctomycetota bacterium]